MTSNFAAFSISLFNFFILTSKHYQLVGTVHVCLTMTEFEKLTETKDHRVTICTFQRLYIQISVLRVRLSQTRLVQMVRGNSTQHNHTASFTDSATNPLIRRETNAAKWRNKHKRYSRRAADFVTYTPSCQFPFEECQLKAFCKSFTETRIEKKC